MSRPAICTNQRQPVTPENCSERTYVFVPVNALTAIKNPSRDHAYVLPTNEVYVLSHDAKKLVKLGGIDPSKFAKKPEDVTILDKTAKDEVLELAKPTSELTDVTLLAKALLKLAGSIDNLATKERLEKLAVRVKKLEDKPETSGITEEELQQAINEIVDDAPSELNTLKKLADGLAKKADKSVVEALKKTLDGLAWVGKTAQANHSNKGVGFNYYRCGGIVTCQIAGICNEDLKNGWHGGPVCHQS